MCARHQPSGQTDGPKRLKRIVSDPVAPLFKTRYWGTLAQSDAFLIKYQEAQMRFRDILRSDLKSRAVERLCGVSPFYRWRIAL